MNLFISADDKFMLAAKVMLTSFFVNNTQENHNVYFMYSSVKDENLTELNKLVESFNSKFIPVMIKESDFEGFICKICDCRQRRYRRFSFQRWSVYY